MFTLDHGLSGLLFAPAAEKVLARKGMAPSPRWIYAILFLAPMWPDCDFWTRFDKRFYDGQMGFVLSHRGITHCLLGAFFFAWLVARLVRRWLPEASARRGVFWLVFFGGALHILEDLPTPVSPWGGLAVFWPIPVRIGDWDKIGWVDFIGNLILVAGVSATLAARKFRTRLALPVSLCFVAAVVIHIARSDYPGQLPPWDAQDAWIQGQAAVLPKPIMDVYLFLFTRLGWFFFTAFPAFIQSLLR